MGTTTVQVKLLEKRITELEKENLILQEKVTFLTRKLYGSKSEQTSSLGIDGQMSIFDEAETFADSKAPEPDMKEVEYRRKRFPGQREELLKSIPHEKKLCTLAEELAAQFFHFKIKLLFSCPESKVPPSCY